MIHIETQIGPAPVSCDTTNYLLSCGEGSDPPVEIAVDFGDGSGQAKWRGGAVPTHLDVFRHMYSLPGTYHISIRSE